MAHYVMSVNCTGRAAVWFEEDTDHQHVQSEAAAGARDWKGVSRLGTRCI